MNINSSYSGFKRTNWDNKNDKEKIKGLKNQFEKVGFKVPKYLEKNKISEKQFNKALNRIDNKYQSIIEKNKNFKMSDIQIELNKRNNLIDKRIKELKKSHNLSDKAIRYLQGKSIFNDVSSRPLSSDKDYLVVKTLDNTKMDKKGKITYMEQIKGDIKKLKNKNFIENLKGENYKENFDNIFGDNGILSLLSVNDEGQELDFDYMLEKYKGLNFVQKEIFLKSFEDKKRELYTDEEGNVIESKLYNLVKNMSNEMDKIRRDI